MSSFRFIGLLAEIAGYRKLERFGQAIDLPDAVASELILGAGAEQGYAGAAALLPDAEFQAIGFTPEELQRFATPATQIGEKAQAFLEKKRAALQALDEYRQRLAQPADPAPAVEETPHA
jgi:hypothetical protein